MTYREHTSRNNSTTVSLSCQEGVKHMGRVRAWWKNFINTFFIADWSMEKEDI